MRLLVHNFKATYSCDFRIHTFNCWAKNREKKATMTPYNIQCLGLKIALMLLRAFISRP